jgi:HEAT repeat protein
MKWLLLIGLIIAAAGCAKAPPTMAHDKPVGHWVQAVRDPDARVRKRAVNVLGNVGTADPAALPALTVAVSDRDAAVRAAAVLALLKIGPPAREAVPALTEAQKDRDPTVRAYAAKALRRIQGSG